MQSIYVLLALLILVGVFFLGMNDYRQSLSPPTPEWSVKAIAVPADGLWRFEYAGADEVLGTADDVYSDKKLYLPESTVCALEVSSEGLSTGIRIPDLRQTSELTPTTFILDHKGVAGESHVYYASEYCGGKFSKMRGELFFVNEARFSAVMAALPRVK